MTTFDPALITDASIPSEFGPEPATVTSAEDGWQHTLRLVLPMAVPATLGLLAVWFLLFAAVLTGFEEHTSQSRLYDRFRLRLAQETAPLAEPVKAGAPIAMIDSAAAGIHKLVVVEGTSSRMLEHGPGHLADTVLPGQVGGSVVMGRSLSYGGPFRAIADMRPGDRLTVTTGLGVFTYRVEDFRTKGDPPPPALKAGQSRLTLVTSAGTGWTSAWAPTRTVFVDAMLVGGPAQPVPAGLSDTVSRASLPMQSDPNALLALILWAVAVLAAVIAVCWSWTRWGRPQAWIVGAPIVFAALWQSGDALMRFLPNLF